MIVNILWKPDLGKNINYSRKTFCQLTESKLEIAYTHIHW